MPVQPLDYSVGPRRRINRRLVKWILVAVAVIGIGFYAVAAGPSSADIRIDTGDLRYRYFGIPLIYEPMSEPLRSQLLRIASGSPVLKPEWHTCVTYPLPSSNNTDRMCRGFYADATAWIAEDPQIARLVLENIARYVSQTNARRGLPVSFDMLAFVVDRNSQGKAVVETGWRQDERVLGYLRQNNYVFPTTRP